MIAWLQPAALWGLTLLAAPLLIHLLRARNAPRAVFPSIRFVRPVAVASVRIGKPSDLLLLALRIGIVGFAVLAMAQPLVLPGSRLAAWNARITRVVVVDNSESMRRQTPGGPASSDAAQRFAAAEVGSASASALIEAADLRDGIRRAVAWLRTASPGRREIVVISDFQHGSLAAADLASVPEDVGLRFMSVGMREGSGSVHEVQPLTAPGVTPSGSQARLLPTGTRVTLVGGGASEPAGLRIISSGGESEARSLLRTVARAGTPAPSAEQPIELHVAQNSAADAVTPLREPWMIRTIGGIEGHAELRRIASETDAGAVTASAAWTVLLRDRRGQPLVRAANEGRSLIVAVAAPASSYFAAAVLRAALIARANNNDRSELEVLSIPKSTLLAWDRQPGPVAESAWRFSDESDSRWCWIAALMLLAVEQWLRRKRSERSEEQRAAA